MRTLTWTILLATLTTLPLLGTASTGVCDSNGYPALGEIELTPGRADGTVYIDDRNLIFGNGIYIIPETNGIWTEKLPGIYTGDIVKQDLQRGWDYPIVPSDSPICVDDPNVPPDGNIIL